ncbi:hypothetical protein HDU81_001499, partial [Chytriomyces hyalinus]
MSLSTESIVLLSFIPGVAIIALSYIERQRQESQRRFQRQCLDFHARLGALTTKMDALEDQSVQMKNALLVAISDGTPLDGLRALFDHVNALLATLRMDYLRYEGKWMLLW